MSSRTAGKLDGLGGQVATNMRNKDEHYMQKYLTNARLGITNPIYMPMAATREYAKGLDANDAAEVSQENADAWGSRSVANQEGRVAKGTLMRPDDVHYLYKQENPDWRKQVAWKPGEEEKFVRDALSQPRAASQMLLWGREKDDITSETADRSRLLTERLGPRGQSGKW